MELTTRTVNDSWWWPTPTNEGLLTMATKNPPPPSWYDDDTDPFKLEGHAMTNEERRAGIRKRREEATGWQGTEQTKRARYRLWCHDVPWLLADSERMLVRVEELEKQGHDDAVFRAIHFPLPGVASPDVTISGTFES